MNKSKENNLFKHNKEYKIEKRDKTFNNYGNFEHFPNDDIFKLIKNNIVSCITLIGNQNKNGRKFLKINIFSILEFFDE